MQLWRLCQGDMGYTSWPDGGGVNEQAAWIVDAFGMLGGIDAELRKDAGD